MNSENNLIKRDNIVGSRRISNYFWSIFLLIGGLGFLLAGLSSYFKINLLPFTNLTDIIFIPQGITMTFYGMLAICLSFYIGLTIFWDIGGGYNEYNKLESIVRIVRNGFPGINRKILLVYPLNNIKSIKVNVQDGLNPRRTIVLCTKDQRQIPLTPVEQPRPLNELETEATNLAKFLGVNLE
jgi:hypothetical protein